MGSPSSFLSYTHFKLKLGVFLTGYTVAMVASDDKKITIICLPMIGHLSDTIFEAAAVVLSHPSIRDGKCWKLLREIYL